MASFMPQHFTPRMNDPSIHSIGGWVGPQGQSGTYEEGANLLCLAVIEP